MLRRRERVRERECVHKFERVGERGKWVFERVRKRVCDMDV